MRPVDADELKKSMDCDGAMRYWNDGVEQTERSYSTLMRYEIADYIDDAPTLDVVDVIRCKDCKYFIPPEDDDFLGECEHSHLGDIYPEKDFFCSFGERRSRNETNGRCGACKHV